MRDIVRGSAGVEGGWDCGRVLPESGKGGGGLCRRKAGGRVSVGERVKDWKGGYECGRERMVEGRVRGWVGRKEGWREGGREGGRMGGTAE